MPSQAYFAGDWYEAVTDTLAGQSPASTPASWAKLSIPSELELAIVEGAAAILNEGEGNADKAVANRAAQESALTRGAMRHVDRGDGCRPEVFTR